MDHESASERFAVNNDLILMLDFVQAVHPASYDDGTFISPRNGYHGLWKIRGVVTIENGIIVDGYVDDFGSIDDHAGST